MLSKTSFVMLNEVKHLAYASCQNSCQRAKCKLVYDFYASAAEINENHKSLRGILPTLRFVRMTLNVEKKGFWTTAISLLKLYISKSMPSPPPYSGDMPASSILRGFLARMLPKL